jgi:hypothetical protein
MHIQLCFTIQRTLLQAGMHHVARLLGLATSHAFMRVFVQMADYIKNERNVLDRLHHPGIAQLQFTFQVCGTAALQQERHINACGIGAATAAAAALASSYRSSCMPAWGCAHCSSASYMVQLARADSVIKLCTTYTAVCASMPQQQHCMLSCMYRICQFNQP